MVALSVKRGEATLLWTAGSTSSTDPTMRIKDFIFQFVCGSFINWLERSLFCWVSACRVVAYIAREGLVLVSFIVKGSFINSFIHSCIQSCAHGRCFDKLWACEYPLQSVYAMTMLTAVPMMPLRDMASVRTATTIPWVTSVSSVRRATTGTCHCHSTTRRSVWVSLSVLQAAWMCLCSREQAQLSMSYISHTH